MTSKGPNGSLLEFHSSLLQSLNDGLHLNEFLTPLLERICAHLNSSYFALIIHENQNFISICGELEKCLPDTIPHKKYSHIFKALIVHKHYKYWSHKDFENFSPVAKLALHSFPLLQKDKVRGFLLINGGQPNSEEINQLMKIASSINIGYQLQVKQENISLMRTQFQLNELLQGNLEFTQPTELIAHSCPIISEHFEAERSTFFAYNNVEKTFQSIHAEGLRNSISLTADKGLIGTCFKSKRPFYTNDPYQRDDFYQDVDSSTGFKTRSALLTPLYLGKAFFGVLQILNSKKGFNDFDLEQIKILSRTLGGHLNTFQVLRNRMMAQNQLEELLETIPEVLYRLDENGMFLFVSQEILKWGYLREELIGKHFKEIIHPSDLENISREIVLKKYQGKVTGTKNSPGLFDERRSGKRGTKRMILRIIPGSHVVFKDIYPNLPANQGEYFYTEVNSSGHWEKDFALNPTFKGTIGVISDVTEKYFAELKLASARKDLIQAERFNGLSTLAAGIAHDFNNILSAIRLSADVSTELVKNLPNNEDLNLNINTIKDCVDKASDLTGRLILFGRSNFAQLETNNIFDVIDDALAIVNYQLFSRRIKLVKEIEDNLPPLMLDRGQIRDVLINLINNSIHAIDRLSNLQIQNRKPMQIKIAAFRLKNEIIVEVSDSGIGIESKILPKIFDPFFTTSNRDSRKGTGLGLAMAFAVVNAHNGRIELNTKAASELDDKFLIIPNNRKSLEFGTTISVSFPIPESNSLIQSQTNFVDASNNFKNVVIYLIDSEKAIVELMCTVLNSLGYRNLFTFKTNHQALESMMTAENFPNIVITDIKTDPQEGMNFCQEILERWPCKQPHIIILSGKLSDDHLSGFQNIGVKHFLKKPCSGEDLLNAVYQCVRQQINAPSSQ